MASTLNTQMVQWSGADFKTVNVNTIQWSDAITLNVEDYIGEIQVHADNQGTPANGDVVDVYVATSLGNVDGSAGDDYETDEHAGYLGRLDTYPTNLPGEDPARKDFGLGNLAAKKYVKIGVLCPQAASRNILIRVILATKRPQ